MSMQWYRAYHGMPYDPKLQVVAKRSGQSMAVVVAVWVCILDAASQHEPRWMFSIDPEEIAVIQNVDVDEVEAVIDALRAKNLLHEDVVVNWHKRQHTTSTERSKKSRAKKKSNATPCNTSQQEATKANASQRKKQKKMTDTDTDLDTDAEEITELDKDTNKENREREEKEECEKEKQQSCGKNTKKQSSKILQQMADIWNEEVQSRITPDQKAILTPKRKTLLAARWKTEFAQDIQKWRYFCEIIGKSDFCLGKIEGKGWTIDLTSAIESSERIAKILEGGFSGGKHPKKPSSCAVPELEDGWKNILQKLEQKFGQPFIRSWFGGTKITKVSPYHAGRIVTLQCSHKFRRDFIEQHFLADINRFWAEQNQQIIATELTIKENLS